MSAFTEVELAFLGEDGHLGRLATVDPDGLPHVVPLGWAYNPDHDTIDIGGRDADEFAATRKFRNVGNNPKVAFVVDDVLPPWRPRAVMVRGRASAIRQDPGDGAGARALIRIAPTQVISWGLQT